MTAPFDPSSLIRRLLSDLGLDDDDVDPTDVDAVEAELRRQVGTVAYALACTAGDSVRQPTEIRALVETLNDHGGWLTDLAHGLAEIREYRATVEET